MPFACYACRQPVEMTASRCPHCTSELSWAGAPPMKPSTYTGPQLTREQQERINEDATWFAVKFTFWLGMVWWWWDEIGSVVKWVKELYNTVYTALKPYAFAVLSWIF